MIPRVRDFQVLFKVLEIIKSVIISSAMRRHSIRIKCVTHINLNQERYCPLRVRGFFKNFHRYIVIEYIFHLFYKDKSGT